MSKASDVFLEHFARLGVFSKVHALIGPTPEEEESAKVKEEKVNIYLKVHAVAITSLPCFEALLIQ